MMEDFFEQGDENFVDDGIQIDPFNLDKEREEGYFDAEGNFVEYVNENEIKVKICVLDVIVIHGIQFVHILNMNFRRMHGLIVLKLIKDMLVLQQHTIKLLRWRKMKMIITNFLLKNLER